MIEYEKYIRSACLEHSEMHVLSAGTAAKGCRLTTTRLVTRTMGSRPETGTSSKASGNFLRCTGNQRSNQRSRRKLTTDMMVGSPVLGKPHLTEGARDQHLSKEAINPFVACSKLETASSGRSAYRRLVSVCYMTANNFASGLARSIECFA